MRRRVLCVAVGLGWITSLLVACERTPEPPPTSERRAPIADSKPSAPPISPTSPASAPGAPAGGTTRYARPAAAHVVAIGDLHGDLSVTRRALKLAGAIDDSDHWVGGALTVVQVGDTIDRGDDDRAVLDLLEKLRVEAQKSGGAMVLVSGNHELMNVAFDFRYVTNASFTSFASFVPTATDRLKVGSLPLIQQNRAIAFAPGGTYARMLADRPVVAKVGSVVYTHGGVLPDHVAYGIDRINDEVRAWMLGERPEPPQAAAGEDGVCWTRVYSRDDGPVDCTRLRQALTAMNADRMVVGHTPQRHGISSACDGMIWRVDVGLSHHYGGPLQVLDIEKDSWKVRKQAD